MINLFKKKLQTYSEVSHYKATEQVLNQFTKLSWENIKKKGLTDWSTAVSPVFNGRRLITLLIIDLPDISYLATFFQINLFYIRFGCKKKRIRVWHSKWKKGFIPIFVFSFFFGSILYTNKKTFTYTHIFILKTWYEYITCKNSGKKNNLNMDLTNKCTNLHGLRQLQVIRFCSMLLITKSSQVIVSAKKKKILAIYDLG